MVYHSFMYLKQLYNKSVFNTLFTAHARRLTKVSLRFLPDSVSSNPMQKAWLRNLAVLLVLQALFFCEPLPQKTFTTEPKAEIDLDSITRRGYITALVDNNSISYFIYKGHQMGFEYELLNLLAKHLKVRLKIKVISGVEQAIDKINKGEADIIAFPLTVTKDRTQYISFTNALFNTYQVLVQRKPDNWMNMTNEELNKVLVRNPVQLAGKEVYVLPATSFELRLKNLSEEIGGDIHVRRDSTSLMSESLIKKVATGKIDYTVADHVMANVNASYYPNLDVSVPISVSQQVAWATRKNSPILLDTINNWLAKIKKEAIFMVIYNKYFKNHRISLSRMKSDYSSIGGGSRISPFDELIREGAKTLSWDWRLLAALIYQESNFLPNVQSWAGAKGLMQLMPSTARRFGAKNPFDPRQSIRAGVRYLKFLDNYWSKKIADPEERLKFILASYNAGLTHINDARRLAESHGKDPNRWSGNVEYFLSKKSDPQYFRNPVVVAGYCRCEETINYVHDILERYEQYRMHILDSPPV